MRRPRGKMRHVLAGLALLLAGASCASNRDETAMPPDPDVITEAPELRGDEASQLVRATKRNVDRYWELRIQGQTQPMIALHQNIARSVDQNFATFRAQALDKELLIQRNPAIGCLAFAIEKRTKARDVLLQILKDEEDPTLLANAALGLGILRDKETDLTQLIRLVGHGDVEVRTSAASTLKELFRIKETPRELTPQHWAAVDRLVTLLHDERTTRGRRAAVWALANLRHPDVLDHLVSALEDKDELVQIGGLRGLETLGDQRGLEPILKYLEGNPTTNAQSYAKRALIKIAVQGGFAKTPSEVEDLGTNPKLWRKWFRNARMK